MTTSTPCPSDGLTARGRRDGFGAQYSAMVSVFVYAARSNRSYCATPWTTMQHGLDASRMFKFIGGAAFGPRATDATPAMADAHARGIFPERRDAASLAFRREIRRFYDAAPKPNLAWFRSTPSCASHKQIAVHVRRGDIGDGRSEAAPSEILGCVAALRARHPCSTVHVMSEGNATALQYLGDVRLHVNEGVEETFHHMVHADALLVASSTFSGIASYLSRGEAWACGGRGRLVSAPGGGPYARTNPWYWVRR